MLEDVLGQDKSRAWRGINVMKGTHQKDSGWLQPVSWHISLRVDM